MPWSMKNIPDSMKNMPPDKQKEAMKIANALLKQGHEDGDALAMAMAQVKRMSKKK